jgi:hypothetical protein
MSDRLRRNTQAESRAFENHNDVYVGVTAKSLGVGEQSDVNIQALVPGVAAVGVVA